jgi:hypothetical protein
MTIQEAERRRRQSKRDREAEQKRRDRHLHDEASLRPDDNRVLTFKQWCGLNGFSESTGRRILAGENGPVFLQLSERRIGITVANNRAWQASRVRVV